MAYAQRGSVPLVEGSIHAMISVASSYALLRESSKRDWKTALVRPLAMLRLCQGFWRKAARLSINRMESEEIQRGRGERFNMGGGRFQGL